MTEFAKVRCRYRCSGVFGRDGCCIGRDECCRGGEGGKTKYFVMNAEREVEKNASSGYVECKLLLTICRLSQVNSATVVHFLVLQN